MDAIKDAVTELSYTIPYISVIKRITKHTQPNVDCVTRTQQVENLIAHSITDKAAHLCMYISEASNLVLLISWIGLSCN